MFIQSKCNYICITLNASYVYFFATYIQMQDIMYEILYD